MIKTITIFLIIATVVFGILQLSSANTINASQPYLNNRISTYMEASEAASIIANSNDLNSIAEAKDHILTVSGGPIFLVGDDRVIWALGLFLTCMDDIDNEKCKDRDMKQLASGLSKAMRVSLSDTGNIKHVELNKQ